MVLAEWRDVHIFIAVGLLVAVSVGQAEILTQEIAEERPLFHIENSAGLTAPVARVGPLTISAQQILLGLEFGPPFVRKRAEPRRRYLEYAINEKLLALGARERKADRLPRVREMLAEIEADLATEELYRDDVLSAVRVTEQEIDRGIAEDRVEEEIRWLFSPTRAGMERYERLIAAGTPFDSVLQLQIREARSNVERSMEISRFRLRDRNPLLAGIVDTLALGEPSGLIKAPDGWYIVQVRNRWESRLLTETRWAGSRLEVKRVLSRNRADSLSDVYVRRMMHDRVPIIQWKAFSLVARHIAGLVLPRSTAVAFGLSPAIPRDSLQALSSGRLVSLKGGGFSIRDFLTWYAWRKYNLSFSRTDRDGFLGSLEQCIWQMVRDRLLAERAFRRGLRTRPAVTTQRTWWQEKLLYETEKEEIARSIATPDTLLRAYFREHRARYRRQSATDSAFHQAADDVRRDFVLEETNRRLLHRLAVLRKKFAVSVDTTALASLPGESDFQPRAIEVYTVKTGGVFPRRAFPTIDPSWAGWE